VARFASLLHRPKADEAARRLPQAEEAAGPAEDAATLRPAEVMRRTLDGRLKVSPSGDLRASERYLLIGREGAARPDPVQAAWLYAQMIRWGQAPMSRDLLEAALGVFRPDIYDHILGAASGRGAAAPRDGIGAFAGPPFDPRDIPGHLAPWRIKRAAI